MSLRLFLLRRYKTCTGIIFLAFSGLLRLDSVAIGACLATMDSHDNVAKTLYENNNHLQTRGGAAWHAS